MTLKSKLFIIISIIVGAFLLLTVFSLTQKIKEHEETESYLREKKQLYLNEIDSLTTIISQLEIPKPEHHLLTPFEVRALQRRGLQNPPEDIVKDLMGRGDLIPFEGILGGTMGFYAPDNIYILSSQWVYAFFDDGHIQGRMILQYRVDDRGAIDWKVIDAYLD